MKKEIKSIIRKITIGAVGDSLVNQEDHLYEKLKEVVEKIKPVMNDKEKILDTTKKLNYNVFLILLDFEHLKKEMEIKTKPYTLLSGSSPTGNKNP